MAEYGDFSGVTLGGIPLTKDELLAQQKQKPLWERVGESLVSGLGSMQDAMNSEKWSAKDLPNVSISDIFGSAVDTLNMPINIARQYGAGLPPIENPVGGSEWIKGKLNANRNVPIGIEMLASAAAFPFATEDILVANYAKNSLKNVSKTAGEYKDRLEIQQAVKELPKSLDTAAAPSSLVQAAASGDKSAFDALAGEVFGRTFERIINKNTGEQLKPMILDKLVENPKIIEDLADKFGYKFKYFTSNPDNLGKKVGDRVVEERPSTRNKLQKQGYGAGNIWVYDPLDVHGAFDNPEYTKAWREIHELSHAITERIMEAKYGKSRRFGALGIDTKNPYDPSDPRTYKALSAEEAQRAIEWEDVAFRTQINLLDRLGIKVDKVQAANDFNIAGSDTVIRTLTGDFSDPANYGVLPRVDDYRINVKDVLQLLENQEKEHARSQGRVATRGIDLNKWEQVSDNELNALINNELENPLTKPTEGGDLLMSIEAVPGASVNPSDKNIIQRLGLKDQNDYLMSMHTALTDQAGSSIIAKKLGLKVGKGDYSVGVWKGETNPVLQLPIQPELDANGMLTQEFKSKLDDMAEIYAKALQQDGVGWNFARYNGENASDQNAIEFLVGSPVGQGSIKKLSAELGDISGIVTTKDGIRFLNISGTPNEEFTAKVESALNKIDEEGDITLYSADSNFIQGATNGNTKQKNSLTRRPDLQEWFDTHVIKQAERVNERYKTKSTRQQSENNGNTKTKPSMMDVSIKRNKRL